MRLPIVRQSHDGCESSGMPDVTAGVGLSLTSGRLNVLIAPATIAKLAAITNSPLVP